LEGETNVTALHEIIYKLEAKLVKKDQKIQQKAQDMDKLREDTNSEVHRVGRLFRISTH
jgi:hypothetical protein